MTDLIEFESKYRKLDPTDLHDALISINKFGRPRLGVYGDDGWHASIDMFVSGVGASFEVKTEFDLKTPTQAVEQLIERMIDTLNKLKS